MSERTRVLAETMALLMSTTPDTKLGKLLNFCLATKVDAAIAGKTPLEMAQALIMQPEQISAWITAAIDGDDDYTVEEMVALADMGLKDAEKFMDDLWVELDNIDLQGISLEK
ncbi:MAG: hypothetical protein AAF215_24665 [Cyanobacteria bacterium P01_A01_bin.123]